MACRLAVAVLIALALGVAACGSGGGRSGGGAADGEQPTAAPGDPAAGKKLFASVTPGCANCHTLADAGAAGTLGPNLDMLRPDAASVSGVVADGRPPMPGYSGKLNAAQISDIAAYVESATKSP